MSTNSYRKCSKCGATPNKDGTISYHRFPRPGVTNVLRARAWAKYCWPNEDWLSIEALTNLSKKNKVLCKRHFEDDCFINENTLDRFSVPGDKIFVANLMKLLRKDMHLMQQNDVARVSAAKTNGPNPSPAKQKEKCSVAIVNQCDQINNSIDYGTISNTTVDNINYDDILDSNYTVDDDEDHAKENNEYTAIRMEENCINTDDDVEFLDETQLNEDQFVHPNFSCNVCRSEIKGFRYTCLQCLDWDMCAACEARREHPSHYVLRIPVPRTYADSEPVVAAIREHIHKLLQMKNEIQELYVKEEIIDEVTEEFNPDVADPILVLNDRIVPEPMSQENNTLEHVVTESLHSNEETIKTCPSDKMNESAFSVSNKYKQLPSRDRKIIIPISSSKTELSQTIKQSEVYKPVIKVKKLGSDSPFYKVMDISLGKKSKEFKPVKIFRKSITTQITNVVDSSLFKNSKVKLPTKQLTLRPESTPASKMSSVVPSCSGRKVIILRKNKLHPMI